MGNVTFFNSNEVISTTTGGGNNGAMLEILPGSIKAAKNAVTYVNIPIPYLKYELKVVYAINKTNNNPITLTIGEVNDRSKARYISLSRNIVDDILYYPLYDKESTNAIHMWIENNYTVDSEIEYELRITSLN